MEHEIQNSKEVTIGKQRYLITHPQVETAWEIGIELTKLIGEPISTMAVGGVSDGAGQALAQAVRSFLGKLDAKTSFLLIKKILASVEYQGQEGEPNRKTLLNDAAIKVQFQGNTGNMFRLAGEVVSFTHEDFFEAITNGVATMMDKATEKVQ